MSITYPAYSSATAELALLLTAYHDTYSNCMLTNYTLAITIDQSTPTIPIEGRVAEDSR